MDSKRRMMAISIVPEWSKILTVLSDPEVSEVEVNEPDRVFIKKNGQRIRLNISFRDETYYMDSIEQGLVPLVTSLSAFSPTGFLFEGRLNYRVGDVEVAGRCHVVLPPSSDFPQITIAKKSASLKNIESIAAAGSMSTEMMQFLQAAVQAQLTIVFSGGTGAGKMRRLSTPIPTPSGWTTMGEIQPGDRVFDHHGNVGKVLKKFPHHNKQVYKVLLSTGEELFVGEDHNFFVSTHRSRKANLYRENGEPFNRVPSLSPEKVLELKKVLLEVNDSETVGIRGLNRIIGKSLGVETYKKISEYARPSDAPSDRKTVFNLKRALEWIVNVYASGIDGDQRYKRVPLYQTLTTKQLMEEGVQDKRGRYNFHIPVLEHPVVFPRDKEAGRGYDIADLPIHPYILGQFLGDGTSRTAGLTASKADKEEYNKIYEDLGINKHLVLNVDNGRSWKYEDQPLLRRQLDALGLIQRTTEEGSQKHVPEIYEFSSPEARRYLLKGLIDTDGTVEKSFWVFTNTNRKIIESVYRIANSLGYRASITKGKPCAYTLGDKHIITGKTSWDVRISTTDVLACLPRKIAIQQQYLAEHDSVMRRDKTRVIRGIEKLENVYEDMACIAVDTPDHTYLSDYGYITDHNTTMLEALSKSIPDSYRIGVAEDVPELNLQQSNVTYLHSVPWQPGMDENDVATLAWVVQQFQRMRTDKIIIGETRGKEFADFLVAANSGMEGSMTTIHAENPERCLSKMTGFALKGSERQPIRAVNNDIANSVNLIVQLVIVDGKHRVSHIQEVTPTLGNTDEAKISTQPLYRWDREQDMFYKDAVMTDSMRQRMIDRHVPVDTFLHSQRELRQPSHGSTRREVQQQMSSGLPRGLPQRPAGGRSL